MKPAYFEGMIQHKLTLASVESISGGYFAWHITKHAHASRFYQGGLVVYNNHMKQVLAHVDPAMLKQHSAISKEVALALAKDSVEQTGCDVAIALVGNAGPTAQDDQPVGKCFIALASSTDVLVKEADFMGDRNAIQQQVVQYADQLIHAWLQTRIQEETWQQLKTTNQTNY